MSRPTHLGMVEQIHTCGDLRDGYDIVFPTLFWVYHINPIYVTHDIPIYKTIYAYSRYSGVWKTTDFTVEIPSGKTWIFTMLNR